MVDKEFWSDNRQFGVRCAEEVLQLMLRTCRQSYPHETGGVLVGFYAEPLDCALVTAASSAPSDSQTGGTWFHRGTYGLQSWLNNLWKRKRNFYLGEWHFHPFAPAVPSQTDIKQMQSIANTPLYHCPEPILIIIGGEPPTEWTVGTYVFPRGRSPLELAEVSERAYDEDMERK